MGEIAEMMMEGILCTPCGVYIGDAVGYPQNCGCNKTPRKQGNKKSGIGTGKRICKKRIGTKNE